ncbi:MAG: hypothetical protein ND807_03190 [Vicinamibacterales bacterium]|nr:hypothetical protein [Vicinamibacterales bacterium]
MSDNVKSIFLVCALTTIFPTRVAAQTSSPWQWRLDANIFAGVNQQTREFTDFTNVESQNWFMGSGERQAGQGRVNLFSMISLEPFTMKDIGSAQVFQTGETYNNQPLIDYQHPHDLISSLGTSYARPFGAWAMTATAAVVGSPALGPTAYMHRASAAENPQAPLSHHNLDSTHATPGVLSFGLARGSGVVEGSWFRGREPDERRTDIDLGALDSFAVRGTWKRGAWEAQASGGWLNEPDPAHPGDVTRLTASIGHTHTGPISTQLFAAWGQNREPVVGPLNAVLLESQISWLDGNYFYSRSELVTKDIIHIIGDHHGGVVDGHPLSNIGAFTLGYTRDLNKGMRARLGIGGDITMYYVPENLKESYGGPVSLHFFLRYRFTTGAMLAGMTHSH